MSTSVENKIVSMTWDGSKFDGRAQASMNVLEKLKASLTFKGAQQGLAAVQKAASRFSLANIGQNVEAIKNKFNSLNIMATAALATITAKAVTAGMQIVRAFGFDQMVAGFKEYELKIGSVQTILANTARYGTTLPQVTKALNELNKYADKTIYNFGDMTKNIGLFTNAGIRINAATKMIQGFSNVAAASGTNAQGAASAAYQLSQALSAGTIRLMDWRSLTTVGMGNKNMQLSLIQIAEGMGRFSGKADVAALAQKDFNGSLKEGWLSAGVMSKYLQMMANDNEKTLRSQLKSIGITGKQADAFVRMQKDASNAAQKVRTFTQLVGTIQESIGSSWSETFEYLIGDFNEATKLWTRVNNTLGKMLTASGDQRNKMLKDWDKLGGQKVLIEALTNVWNGLWSAIKPVQEAFAEIFPPTTGQRLYEMTVAFRDLTARFKMGASQIDAIKGIARGFFWFIKAGGSVLHYFADGVGIALTIAGKLLTILWNLSAPVRNFVAGLIKGVDATGDFGSFVSSLVEKLIELRTKALQPVYEWLDKLAGATDGWKDLGKGVSDAKTRVVSFAGSLEWLSKTWESIKDFGIKTWDVIKTIARGIGDFILKIGSDAPAAFRALGDSIRSVGEKIKSFFGGIGDAWQANLDSGVITQLLAILQSGILLGFFLKFKKYLAGSKSIKDTFVETLETLGGAFEQLTATLKTMQNDIKANIILKIAAAVALLAGAMWILSKVDPDRLMTASVGLGVAMGVLLVGVGIMAKIAKSGGILQMPVIALALALLAGALILLAVAVERFAGIPWEQMWQGLAGVATGVLALSIALKIAASSSGQLISAAFAMGIMAGALILFAIAVERFGAMDMGVLIQGGIAVGALLAVLVGFSYLDPKRMAELAIAMVAIAASVNGLVAAVYLLGIMDIGTLVQGGLAVVALMGSLAIAAKLAQGSMGGAAAIVALAFALNLLLIPILVLGNVDVGALAQGFIAIAIGLGLLAGAAKLMQGAIGGAGAIVAMSFALGILATVILIMGTMDIATVAQGLGVLALTLLGFAGIAAVLSPIAPAMFALSGAIALLGLGIALIGGGMIAFAVGLTLLGPAAAIGAGGMQLLAAACASLAPQVPAVLAVAGAFLILGVAVLALGAGVVILAAGISLMAVGLTLLAASGTAGADALMKVVEQIKPLIWDVLTIGAIGAAFAVLGAGFLLAGAGAATFAAGGAAMVVVLMALMFVLPGVTPHLQAISDAAGKLSGAAKPFIEVAAAMQTFTDKSNALVSSASQATGVLSGFVTTLSTLGSAAKTAGKDISALPKQISSAAKGVGAAFKSMKTQTDASVKGIGTSLKNLDTQTKDVGKALPKSTELIVKAFTTLGTKGASELNKSGAKIKSGLNTLKGSVESSAKGIGNAILDGMVRGMANSGKVSAAARSVALKALAAAKDALDSHSPSREFEKLGKFANEGFAKGLRGNSDEVQKAFDDMKAMITSAISTAKQDIKTAQSRLNRLNKNKKKNKKAIKEAKAELALAKKLKKNGEAASKELTKQLADERDALKAKADELDGVNEKLKEAQANLDDAIKERDDTKKSYADQYSKLPEIAEDTSLDDFIAQMQAQIAATRKFNVELAELRAAGLNDKMYKELLAKGLDAQPFLDQIRDAGWGGVTNLNALADQLDAEAGDLGKNVSIELYQAGVDAAQGIVDGIQAQADEITKAMDAIADSMVNAIKKKLGIQSPSKVLAGVGRNSAKGIGKGLDEGTRPVVKKAENLADKVTTAVEDKLSLRNMGDLGFDTVPVIRPTMDLTDIRAGAAEIDALLTQAALLSGRSYVNAAAMSRADRAQGEPAGNDDYSSDGNTIIFNQTNNSPKALSRAEIYRQTRNQISMAKGVIDG